MKIHIATINHRHGTNTYVSRSREDLLTQIHDYVDTYWGELGTPPPLQSKDPEAAVYFYFANHAEEILSLGSEELALPFLKDIEGYLEMGLNEEDRTKADAAFGEALKLVREMMA